MSLALAHESVVAHDARFKFKLGMSNIPVRNLKFPRDMLLLTAAAFIFLAMTGCGRPDVKSWFAWKYLSLNYPYLATIIIGEGTYSSVHFFDISGTKPIILSPLRGKVFNGVRGKPGSPETFLLTARSGERYFLYEYNLRDGELFEVTSSDRLIVAPMYLDGEPCALEPQSKSNKALYNHIVICDGIGARAVKPIDGEVDYVQGENSVLVDSVSSVYLLDIDGDRIYFTRYDVEKFSDNIFMYLDNEFYAIEKEFSSIVRVAKISHENRDEVSAELVSNRVSFEGCCHFKILHIDNSKSVVADFDGDKPLIGVTVVDSSQKMK